MIDEHKARALSRMNFPDLETTQSFPPQPETEPRGSVVVTLPAVCAKIWLYLDAWRRLHCGDAAGALLDFDRAVDLSAGARGEYFVQRARARARVAMRSNGREEAMAGVKVCYNLKPHNKLQ